MIAKFDKSPLKIAQIYSNLPIFTQKIQKSRPKKATFNKACYNFRVIFAFVLFCKNLRPLSVDFIILRSKFEFRAKQSIALNSSNLSVKFTLNAKISHQKRHDKAKKQEKAAKTKEQKAKI